MDKDVKGFFGVLEKKEPTVEERLGHLEKMIEAIHAKVCGDDKPRQDDVEIVAE